MPNWVINRIEIENSSIEEIIKNHIRKDSNGLEGFDFNTILKMPEDLKIEKSSRSADGFKLYIAKKSPFIENIGNKEEKIPASKYLKDLYRIFGHDCIDNLPKYFLRPSDVDKLRDKYGEDFENVLALGEKVFNNIRKYGVPDWYDWSVEHWGTKWNACNTYIDSDKRTITFDTAWSPAYPIIEKLAEKYPHMKIIYSFAEEQTGFNSGQSVFEGGVLVSENIFAPFSKEAYEMSFKLWGVGDEYVFDEEKNTYIYIGQE